MQKFPFAAMMSAGQDNPLEDTNYKLGVIEQTKQHQATQFDMETIFEFKEAFVWKPQVS